MEKVIVSQQEFQQIKNDGLRIVIEMKNNGMNVSPGESFEIKNEISQGSFQIMNAIAKFVIFKGRIQVVQFDDLTQMS